MLKYSALLGPSCDNDWFRNREMKLEIHNIARVSEANIDLSGIAVVTGGNATGKSTLCRAVMTLCSVSSRLAMLLQMERVKSIFEVLQESVRKYGGELLQTRDVFPNAKSNSWISWLSKSWWGLSENLVSWLQTAKKNPSEPPELMAFPNDFEMSDKFSDAIKDARPKIVGILDRPDLEYVRYVCEKAFRRAFRSQMQPLHRDGVISSVSLKADGKTLIEICFRGSEVVDFTEMGRTVFPSVVYFEPVHLVDFIGQKDFVGRGLTDRYTAGELCSCRTVSKAPPKNLTLEAESETKEVLAILSGIIKVIHGHLKDDDRQIRFSETIADAEYLIDVKNMASGMKTMAAIVRAFENGSIKRGTNERRGSLLIIDEPESNLHPEWQVKFAQFLVLVHKHLGVHLLLNTHSPYFLQAIKVFSSEDGVQDCNFYEMVPEYEGRDENELIPLPIANHSELVNDEIKRVFQAMARPFHELV